MGAFVVSSLLAFTANIVFRNMLKVSEWNVQNFAVVPMVVASALAVAFRTRWVQIVLLSAWVCNFSFLQSALS
jgi:hypothetical protein